MVFFSREAPVRGSTSVGSPACFRQDYFYCSCTKNAPLKYKAALAWLHMQQRCNKVVMICRAKIHEIVLFQLKMAAVFHQANNEANTEERKEFTIAAFQLHVMTSCV